MEFAELGYGSGVIRLDYYPGRFDVIAPAEDDPPLTDAEIGERLDRPVGCDRLEDVVGAGETVLFVVPDATRQAGAGQILNLLARRLIANGTEPFGMAVIFATGIHRPVTENEKRDILTPFIVQRIKTLDHNPRDLMQIANVGTLANGTPVELNRALLDFDHVVLIGGVTFHYFAGFTGGRKLVCPGLASTRTTSATHKLAFDCKRKDRREGVGTAMLDGNAVHEAFVEAASKVKVAFSVNTIVNDAGEITDIYCGDPIAAHRAACDAYALKHTIQIAEKRELVIASCGGDPFDINMIQAHKTLEAASHACSDGGTIILLAECRDGLGRDDFLNWFDAEDSRELAHRLCERYQVNGQTAWSLLRKTERFDVKIVTGLDKDAAKKMRLQKISSIEKEISGPQKKPGYIMPYGSKTLVRVNQP